MTREKSLPVVMDELITRTYNVLGLLILLEATFLLESRHWQDQFDYDSLRFIRQETTQKLSMNNQTFTILLGGGAELVVRPLNKRLAEASDLHWHIKAHKTSAIIY
jgi:hypothetical protein